MQPTRKNSRIIQQIKARILCGEKRLKNPFFKVLELASYKGADAIENTKLFYTCKRRLRKSRGRKMKARRNLYKHRHNPGPAPCG